MAGTFPQDLIDAQLRLHQARAEYEALCRTLPWSVEPLDGWPGQVHPHTGEVTGGREPSPGYTDEQKTEVARLQALVLELSLAVSTHPHWETLEGEKRVQARMELKHHPDAVPAVDIAVAA
ncbi:hypothetical protein GPZ77_34335 (plasmid) [Streptomyces sp. QHH-9511]|uniref:hypothetical protein n=1 Tax=Streptomyces sp. QHH-9511 TaxID=2684468 RepID=UPI001317D453|nr:hypothetical protein [Streptomyces sp. QHH-9511]QGZ53311.1 hypothetical protein GPZ77_34335 [Streptomyces sp. QHH-9511]